MLDWAEAFGMPVDALERQMTLREISERQMHKPPWTRRFEVMLAQLAYVVARSAGVKVEPEEFDIFGPKPDPKQLKADDAASIFGAMTGGPGVRVLGKKRREKQAKKEP